MNMRKTSKYIIIVLGIMTLASSLFAPNTDVSAGLFLTAVFLLYIVGLLSEDFGVRVELGTEVQPISKPVLPQRSPLFSKQGPTTLVAPPNRPQYPTQQPVQQPVQQPQYQPVQQPQQPIQPPESIQRTEPIRQITPQMRQERVEQLDRSVNEAKAFLNNPNPKPIKPIAAKEPTTDKPFICQYCGFACTKIQYLNMHLSSKHRKELGLP